MDREEWEGYKNEINNFSAWMEEQWKINRKKSSHDAACIEKEVERKN